MTEELERITILLQAKDRDFARAMDRNNKLIARLSRDAKKNTTDMAKTIDTNLSALNKKVADFGVSFAKGLAGGAVATAFGMLTTQLGATIRSVAQLGNEAKRSGLSAQAFQEWKFVAEQNRIGVDQLVDGFKELNLRADELIQTGAGPAAESFRRLGYTATDLAAKLKDPSALMLEILGRMEGMDEAARIRIADELFGGSAGERFVELLGNGDGALRQTIARAHEVGAVLDEEMIAKAQELDRRWGELKTRAMSFFQTVAVDGVAAFDLLYAKASDLSEKLPIILQPDLLEDAIELWRGIGNGAGEAADQVSAALGEIDALANVDLRDKAQEMAQSLYAMVDALDAAGDGASAAALEGVADQVQAIADAAVTGQIEGEALRAQLVTAASAADTALASIENINGINLDSAKASVGGLIGYLNAAAQAAANVMAQAASATIPQGGYDPQMGRFPPITELDVASGNAPRTSPRPVAAPVNVDFDYGGVGSGGGGGGGSRAEDRYGDKLAAMREEVAGLLAEAEALNAATLAYDEYGIAQEVARKKAELLQAAQDAGKDLTPELRAEIDALAESYVGAAEAAEAARERHDEFQSALQDMRGTMEGAFVGLVTGAHDFKTALASVIAKLAEMAAMSAFDALWQGGLGDVMGGIIGGLTGTRATGGGVKAGGAYLVNENTPRSEVFVPSQNGAILNVPQAQAALRATASAGPQVVYVPQPYIASVSADDDGRIMAHMSRIGDESAARMGAAMDRALPARMQQISQSPRKR